MENLSVAGLGRYIVVDETRIVECGGDHEFLQCLLHDFIEVYGDAPQRLRTLLAERESGKALKLLHAIRGGSANIGLLQIAAVAGGLERVLKEERDLLSGDLLASFELAIKNLCDYMLEKNVIVG